MYRNCFYCGKRFFVEPEEEDLPDNDFCSWKCEDMWWIIDEESKQMEGGKDI